MEGQLNDREKSLIVNWVEKLQPERALEIGTYVGGGSTIHILHALERNGRGHLWGIEASKPIYEEMVRNITSAGPQLLPRFSPIFGFSQKVIPVFLSEEQTAGKIEFVFLDGGDNPMEQVEEFQLLRDHIPVGNVLMSHDALLRKGKWLIPYLRAHDNWQCKLHEVSDEGLFEAVKIAPHPSDESMKNAEKVLRSLRRQPVELVGRLLPSRVIDILLRMLPRRVVVAITQGRK